MNGMRRFLAGGLAGSSQPDPASPPPVSPLAISANKQPSWPPSTPPAQPLIAQELTESPTPSPKASTPGLFLRKDKPRPPPPQDDALVSSRASSVSNSPSRGYGQGSPRPQKRKSVVDNPSSGLLNTRDELLMSLLASEAVVDSRGFEILSSEQVEDLKKEHQVLSSRLVAMSKKLTLETKIRDAAVSLSKVNSPYKAVSKQTSEQLESANRKVELAQKELWKVSERANDIYRKLLEHRAGVLSFSVRSMESKQSDGQDTPSLVGSELLSGASTPVSRNGSFASPVMSPSRKFEHFFAGHADSVVPQVPRKPPSIGELLALEEKLQAVTQNLGVANKKQAEMARDLSLLKLEKDQVQTSMEMEMQNAEDTITALEKEISKLEDLDSQVRGFQDEKRVWEEQRVELDDKRKQVETLERRLEVLEERSGEASEMERLLDQKETEISRLKDQWEEERASWQKAKQVADDDSSAQLDEAFSALRNLIQSNGIMLNSRNAGSSLMGLVDSVSSHLEGFTDVRAKLEEARTQQEESRKEIHSLSTQTKEQSEKIQELLAQQTVSSLPPVEYTGDSATMAAALLPIWSTLPSAEARGAKLGQSRFRSPSNGTSGGPMKPSLSEMDVRSLKTLYDSTKSGQPQSSAVGFTIEAFVMRVQALINDDRALIERLLRFAQAHDLLKKNAERAQKLALDSNNALETYQKQVKTLEDRDIAMSAKYSSLLDEVHILQDTLDRIESERRDLEMQAADQAETCRQLTDANNALSAKTLGLAEESAFATDAVRRQMDAQLTELKMALQNARDEVDALHNSEQTQKVALLEELNTMQTENSNLRAQLRNKK